MNQLYYGDNLEILRDHIHDESVDLIYLDPPFNSNRSYNVLFAEKSGHESQAQMQAFDDTWTWSQDSAAVYRNMVEGGEVPEKVAEAIRALRALLSTNDLMAYLVMMTPRLVEMHRVLKSSGSLYLHCDPTVAAYLKLVLDSVFGVSNFRNEIVWQRTNVHSDSKRWSDVSDRLLYYVKDSRDSYAWNAPFVSHSEDYVESKYRQMDPDGRRFQLDNMTSPNPRPNMMYEWRGHESPAMGWRYSRETMARLDAEGRIWYPKSKDQRPRLKRYLDEQRGRLLGDVWTDINPINSQARERLGYPTQKPVALLERILSASSNPGDVVLDPFCGCGTTISAAHKLGRRWIGIDIAFISVDLVRTRLVNEYGPDVVNEFTVEGIPFDLGGARSLFDKSPFEFERWAVSLVGGTPNERQVGDKGIDGMARFPVDGKGGVGRIAISVKGGGQLNPGMTRDLLGSLDHHEAVMGIMITLEPPTRGMMEVARNSGTYTNPLTQRDYPRVQIVTVAELLDKRLPQMPGTFAPYIKASRVPREVQQRLMG